METSIRRTLGGDGTATVTVYGEIDFANADQLGTSICDAVADRSPAVVHVDLREAAFIDSTGLGALIEGYRAATDAQVRFVVCNPTATFRRVLTVTGLCEIFGLTDAADAAGEEAQPAEATGA
jgi:anti-sigma B factor antagonist